MDHKKTAGVIGIMGGAAIAAVALTIACSNTDAPLSKAGITYGPSASFGQGTARTWVQTDESGAAVALGLALSETAMTGLPTTAPGPSPSAIMLALTLPAAAAGTGFDHAEIGWNPNGHEPQALYGLPHFDLHFYMVSAAAESAILPSDPQYATKAANFPSASFVPATYVAPPGPPAANAVPQMGLHWTSVASPELNGQTFTNTFIYGSWDGQFIFMEPMVTRAYLLTHPSATQAIPQPARWAKTGRYPTRYTVGFDSTTKEYRFTLGGLTAATGS